MHPKTHPKRLKMVKMHPKTHPKRLRMVKGKVLKKHKKNLTNVSLYVCMSAENSKMLVFVCFFKFFPIVA